MLRNLIGLVVGAEVLGGKRSEKAAFITAPFAITAAAAAGAQRGAEDYEARQP